MLCDDTPRHIRDALESNAIVKTKIMILVFDDFVSDNNTAV